MLNQSTYAPRTWHFHFNSRAGRLAVAQGYCAPQRALRHWSQGPGDHRPACARCTSRDACHGPTDGKGSEDTPRSLDAKHCQGVKQYLSDEMLLNSDRLDVPLFRNRRGEPFSRWGIRYLLVKYRDLARKERSTLPANVTPHTLRHTKAMHLLQAGNPAIVIRDVLGHAHIRSTEVYARADLEMKRKARESGKTLATTRAETMAKRPRSTSMASVPLSCCVANYGEKSKPSNECRRYIRAPPQHHEQLNIRSDSCISRPPQRHSSSCRTMSFCRWRMAILKVCSQGPPSYLCL